MDNYVIKKLRKPIALGTELSSPAWDDAMVAELSCFPWYKSGEKHATQARLLNDGENLHLLFIAQDTHISAIERDLNGHVCCDSHLSRHCGEEVSFSGKWTGNFYRCGGQTNQQYACWHELPGANPNFHQPNHFGNISFE